MFKVFNYSTVILSALAITVPSEAQSVEAQSVADLQITRESYSLSPRQLIAMARHGRFKAQGIPSHSNFGNGIRSGRVTAESLVQSAIENDRLPENAIRDRQYLKAVNKHLKSGGCGSV